MRVALICTTMLFFTACIDEQSGQSTGKPSLSTNSPVTAKPDQKPRKYALTNTSISFADAIGVTSKMIEIDPCPFASDEIIKSQVFVRILKLPVEKFRTQTADGRIMPALR